MLNRAAPARIRASMVVLALAAAASGSSVHTTPSSKSASESRPDFEKPTPEEALKFLQSLPKRKFKEGWKEDPRKIVQFWSETTVEDIRALKTIHPGCHTNKDGEPPRHLRLKPEDWRYFTALESLEAFEMTHDLEGCDDACFFHLGQLPQTMRRVQMEMSDATGTGVAHLANLKNLVSLSLNFSRTITDVALVNAAKIESLEYLDVNGCPGITGSGVAALAKLKNLEVLKIGGCSLSDQSLQNFKSLTVEELDLSDNVAEWVVRYRGGGRHDFAVTFAGLKDLLSARENLPNLKRLIVQKHRRSLRKDEILTKSQKAELARLRPGLEVR